ncbi:hypothetical protein ACFQ08_04740 [Streptosporangium algeriense]|uniref:Uncharacterized protein n=1 Tax=Streptosporangium algeriense TaxID=1682748 RepID=A0ABW3DJD0_9ACTN
MAYKIELISDGKMIGTTSLDDLPWEGLRFEIPTADRVPEQWRVETVSVQVDLHGRPPGWVTCEVARVARWDHERGGWEQLPEGQEAEEQGEPGV